MSKSPGVKPRNALANKGTGGTLIALMRNPNVRRVVAKGAGKVVSSAAALAASRAAKKEAADTTPAAPGSAASSGDSAAVESIVSSVAKPLADKMATSGSGRSILETISSITSQALGTTDPARREGPTVASFVSSLMSGQTSAQPAKPAQPSVKFTPVKPSPGATAAPQPSALQWPPPKNGNPAGE